MAYPSTQVRGDGEDETLYKSPTLDSTVVLPFYEIAGLTTERSEAQLERSNRLQYTDLEQKLRRQFADGNDLGMERSVKERGEDFRREMSVYTYRV